MKHEAGKNLIFVAGAVVLLMLVAAQMLFASFGPAAGIMPYVAGAVVLAVGAALSWRFFKHRFAWDMANISSLLIRLGMLFVGFNWLVVPFVPALAIIGVLGLPLLGLALLVGLAAMLW